MAAFIAHDFAPYEVGSELADLIGLDVGTQYAANETGEEIWEVGSGPTWDCRADVTDELRADCLSALMEGAAV